MTHHIEIIEVHLTHITVHRWLFCDEGCLSESIQYSTTGEIKTLKAASLKPVKDGVNRLLKAI